VIETLLSALIAIAAGITQTELAEFESQRDKFTAAIGQPAAMP
jgi:hypothetical protein